MSELESQQQPEVDSQTNSVTNDSVNKTEEAIPVEQITDTDKNRDKKEETEGVISEVTPIVHDIESKEEDEEVKSPIVSETEEEEEGTTSTPLPPPIFIVTEDGESQKEETPEVSIHVDEPQTPVPTTSVTPEESTIPDDASNSTLTPESLNDDTKPIIMNESDFQGPVIDFYKNKNILLTGVTGFIGKAILWKLIQSLRQDIGQIYILIRSGSIKRSKIGRPEERLRNEIFNNKVCTLTQKKCSGQNPKANHFFSKKAFLILRRMMGKTTFDSIVKNKIIPIAGDIISPDLSMTEFDRERITENVNVVIHCAATLNYSERLDLALEVNIYPSYYMHA